MASAKMTLIGMYNYRNDIFNELVLPTGIDADMFKNALLMQSGEFEVLYPDPDFLKFSIKVWSTKWFRTFSEWLRGTQQTWNPIFNYDRFETIRNERIKEFNSKTTADYSDDRRVDLDDTRTADLKDMRTADLTEKTNFDNSDTTTQIDEMTTEHEVAAYDTSSYSPSSKDIVNNGQSKIDHTGNVTNSNTGTDTTEHTGTDIMKHTGSEKTTKKGTLSDNAGSESGQDLHEAHMYGNIGVTTSAAMLKEFYDISSWNLYQHMCDVFTSELLIPVYD